MLNQFELIKQHQISVKKHLGQHLLVDPNIIEKIVAALEIKSGDHVLEIGPGLGALTPRMLRRGAFVTAIEKDKRFASILKEGLETEFPGKTKIICDDFLKTDLNNLFSGQSHPIKVVSNLPYYITTPILFKLIEFHRLFDFAVLMMQKEVADRLTAKAGTKDYGRLTVSAALQSRSKKLFRVACKCFVPAPDVVSAVIELRFKSPELPESEIRMYDAIVRASFSSRRKMMLNVLTASGVGDLTRADWQGIFSKHGIPEKIRGEKISPETYLKMARAAAEKCPKI